MYGLVVWGKSTTDQPQKEAIELTSWDDCEKLMLYIATTDISYDYPGQRFALILSKTDSTICQKYLRKNAIKFTIKKVIQRHSH